MAGRSRRMYVWHAGLVVAVLSVAAACVERTTGTAGTSAAPPVTSSATTVPETDAAATSSSSTSTTSSTTTTSTLPLITVGAVVLVANASNVDGAAGKFTAELQSRGFTVAKATNADGLERELKVSKIYYLPEGRVVAESLAKKMGGLVVGPMPTPASISGANAALGDATVLVLLGYDFAGKSVPGIS